LLSIDCFFSISRPSPTCFWTCDFFGGFLLAVVFRVATKTYFLVWPRRSWNPVHHMSRLVYHMFRVHASACTTILEVPTHRWLAAFAWPPPPPIAYLLVCLPRGSWINVGLTSLLGYDMLLMVAYAQHRMGMRSRVLCGGQLSIPRAFRHRVSLRCFSRFR